MNDRDFMTKLFCYYNEITLVLFVNNLGLRTIVYELSRDEPFEKMQCPRISCQL